MMDHYNESWISRSLQTLAECRQPNPSMEYFCPISRYCEWTSHSRRTLFGLSDGLGYIARSWNYDALVNSIETTSYSDLDIEKQSKLQSLGFDEDTHDCCHVHYNDYDWTDFDDEGRIALSIFGYDEESWNSNNPTVYDDMFWDSLPFNVKEVAMDYFCYSKELWDGISLSNWQTDTYIPGSYEKRYAFTLNPTSDITEYPSYFPSQQPTQSPTKIPTDSPTPIPSNYPTNYHSTYPTLFPSNAPTNSPVTPQPTENPSSSPTNSPVTPQPTENPSSSPTNSPVTPQPTESPSSSPTNRPTNNPTFSHSSIPTSIPSSNPTPMPTSKPTQRPSSKPSISPSSNPSTSLKPTTRTLNPTISLKPSSKPTFSVFPTFKPTSSPTTNPTISPSILHSSFPSLFFSTTPSTKPSITISSQPTIIPSTLPSVQPTTTPTKVSSTSPTIQHSIIPSRSPSNNPSMKPSSYPSIHPSIYPSSYPSIHPSIYPSIYPSALPTKQPTIYPSMLSSSVPSFKPTSSRPTYHPTNTHRPTSIEFAGKTYSPTTRPTVDVRKICRTLDPMVEYWCPIKRYCEWDFYDLTTRFDLQIDLGYSEKSWNYEVPAESENIAFSELKSTSQDTLKTLGFDEDKHDCCNGHYLSYFWNELHDEAREAWELLGYNEEMWESEGFSKYDEYDWDDLPRDIQLSASAHLCYSRELWDQEPLPLWPQNAILPGAFIGGEPVTGLQSGVFQSQTSGGNMLRACSNLGMSVIAGMLLMFNLVL